VYSVGVKDIQNSNSGGNERDCMHSLIEWYVTINSIFSWVDKIIEDKEWYSINLLPVQIVVVTYVVGVDVAVDATAPLVRLVAFPCQIRRKRRHRG
jgi:hypothetical protein